MVTVAHSSVLLSFTLSSPEYRHISVFYGVRKARRSQVPLMNHIDEGISLMAKRGAPIEAIKAYCIHPLLQDDRAFCSSILMERLKGCDVQSVILATEYRHVANSILSRTPDFESKLQNWKAIVPEIREMLIADKVQNYKDFRKYHQETHPQSKTLEKYFKCWLKALQVNAYGRDK